MANWLSNLIDNLADIIHKIKFKDCYYFHEYKSANKNLIKDNYLSCNTSYSNKIDEKFKKVI